MTFGDSVYGTNVTLGSAKIIYDNMITDDGPIILNSLPFPFTVKITEKNPFVEVDKIDNMEYSRAGICMALTRTSKGHLFSGYYYPRTAFALLSMISYLINPDLVSYSITVLINSLKVSLIINILKRFLEEWE